MMKVKTLIIVFLFGISYSFGQNLTVSSSVTPVAMANSLVSGCAEVIDTTVNYTGSPNAKGGFGNGQSIGLPGGIILSTGWVLSAPGPNNNNAISQSNGQSGDAELETVLGATAGSSSDAAVLEFDFIPHGHEFEITWVFASEAYHEMIGMGSADGFAILISGPGVAGAPAYANENIAVVPGTPNPITIDNLNFNTPPGGPYYIDNFLGPDLQYDGFTTPITSSLAVVPCQTYHMKIVIADINDPNHDSAVLIGAGSLISDFNLIVTSYSNSGSAYDITESCTNQLVISRADPLDTNPFIFNIDITGTSTEGVDFTGISTGQYTISPTQTNMSIDYIAVLDGLTEGIETIIFTFSHVSMCDSTCIGYFVIEIEIFDNWELQGGIVQNDTGICGINTNFVELQTYIPANMDPLLISYNWDNGSSSANRTVEPSVGAINYYKVTITDICGQSVVDSIAITNSDFTDIQIGVVDNLCYGDENGEVNINTVDGMAPFTYTWSPAGLGSATSGNVQNLAAGAYFVTVTDSVGCTMMEPFVVAQPDSIYSSLTVTNATCHGYSNGEIFFETFEGIPPFTFQWSNGTTQASLSSVPAGFYSVTAHDLNGCEIVDEGIITEPDSLWITASNDVIICEGQTIMLDAQAHGGTPLYFFDWSNGGAAPSISITPTTSTVYTVQVYDLNNCLSNIEFVQVDLYPPISLQLNAVEDSICLGDETTILANIHGGTGGPYKARFYDGASSELLPPPYFVSPDVTTTYEVWIDDFCGSPTGYYSITIFVFEPPDIEIRADIEAGCKPLTVNFYDELYEAGKTYDWDYGDGSNDLLSYLPNPEHTFYSTGIYSVTLEVISPAGCVSIVTHPELIEVYPVPKARFHPDPVITSIVDPHVFFNNNSDDNFINTWDFGDGSDPSNAINGEHLYHGVGEYLITLNIENEEGCVDKTEQIITIRNEYTFYVPNAISPNSMITENRYFMATGVGIDPKNFHMIIYDRWGTKIFETFDVFHPWDGRVFGSDAEKGASFPWVIIYKDMNGEEHRESGTVTVIN